MIYFDNSATTFYKPAEVINTVVNTLKYLSANPGRGGHSMSTKAGLMVYKARENMAQYLGATSVERITFSLNCTEALNMAIQGTVKSGGNIITTAYEHNSVLRPLFELQRSGKITVTVIEPNEAGVVTKEMIEANLKKETYMIITNHISNVTGAVTPVKSIGKFARQNNILYLVDGAQSVGYREVSLVNDFIDLLAVAPHKGLHAVQGLGVLAVGKNVDIKPIIFGGTGTDSSRIYQPSELPEALESGTLPTPAIAALAAAINWSENNRSEMAEKLTGLSSYFIDSLGKMDNITIYTPKNLYNGIVAFNINTLSSTDVTGILSDQYDMCARGGLHCAPLIHKHLGTLEKGIVRVSFGVDNSYRHVDHLIKAIEEISASK